MLFGANSTNRRHLEFTARRGVELLLETGLHAVQEPDRTRFMERLESFKNKRSLEPLHLLWSGELQTRKALPILLHALARLDSGLRWQLDVLGDGPMRAAWTEKAAKLAFLVDCLFQTLSRKCKQRTCSVLRACGTRV